MARNHAIVIRSAAELPPPVIDAFITEMATHMSRTPEARSCVGLSFTFISSDVDVPPARYEVGRGGVIHVRRGDRIASTFTFAADADTFDSVLRGSSSAIAALLRRDMRASGSLRRISSLLRMMPALHLAYAQSRERLDARYRSRYRFAF